jgi:hypothetical protein|tara:strand:+ start:2826 stop:3029 length:204 start_codon:yes stop_codon:yes gene_type:complete
MHINESQSSQLSQISPGSFYTPNSFYQQPNLSGYQQEKFGGIGSGKIVKKTTEEQNKGQQLSNVKIP